MKQWLRCLFGRHKKTMIMPDPDGEYDVEGETIFGTVDLWGCVACKKVWLEVTVEEQEEDGEEKVSLGLMRSRIVAQR